MGSRADVYPLGLCIALCLWGTVAQNHGIQGTTEDCNSHVLCPANTECVNNTHCTCLDGYQPHGNRSFFTDPTEICDDINECLGPSLPDCGRKANSTNVAGSYHCICIDGYESSSGKANFTLARENTCQDIDECQGPSPADCGPHTNCTNLPGNYYCTCIDGYKPSSEKVNFTHASEKTCQDIDECRKIPDICGPKATCINTNTSYRCGGYVPIKGPSNNSSVQFEGIKETFRNFSLQTDTFPESYPLTIITYVGLTISLLCLFLAILTFLLCRSIRNVSTSLHLQLCLCLFLADLLLLTPVTHTGSQVACAVIVGLLQYVFLACFSWMFLEGLHLFLTVRNLQVVNYTSTSWFIKRFMYPFGYGFPALVVAISAVVNHEGYGTSKHCWFSLERGFHWSFLGPVCAIILINIMFFALTLWILRNRLSSLNADVSTLRDHRLLTFKAIAQFSILGCTWVLCPRTVFTVMSYLFTIVNSLQGAFIFLVHCLLNRQVREEYKRWIKGFRTSSTKSQTSDLSMSAVPNTTTKTV